MSMNDQAASVFTGTWHLRSCETRGSDGQVRYPYGDRPIGQLLYDGAGNMSAQLGRADRVRFAGNDPAKGTDAELRDAFNGYVAYFGAYDVDATKNEVTHRVVGASFPNWTGVELVRRYRFDDDGRLWLTTPPTTVGGVSFEYVLLWERKP